MEYRCSICKKKIKGDTLVYLDHAQGHVIDVIKARHPEWAEKDGLCPKCEEYFQAEIKGKSPE